MAAPSIAEAEAPPFHALSVSETLAMEHVERQDGRDLGPVGLRGPVGPPQRRPARRRRRDAQRTAGQHQPQQTGPGVQRHHDERRGDHEGGRREPPRAGAGQEPPESGHAGRGTGRRDGEQPDAAPASDPHQQPDGRRGRHERHPGPPARTGVAGR
jgi:hypothetical protein